MAHDNHEQAIKKVYIGLAILAAITVVEVLVSLFGKGHIVEGVQNNRWVIWIAALLIIGLSLYKAKFIIYEFMHMKYEVPGLVRTVLLPVLLLVWAIIAFFYEGNTWKERRAQIDQLDARDAKANSQQGMLLYKWTEEDFQ